MVSRYVDKALRRARYVEIPGAGHVAPLEQPTAFAELLLEFLDKEVG